MHIVHLASEAVPLAKTGGLADVVGGLTTDLARRGHEVSLFLPGYRVIRDAGIHVFATGVAVDVPVGPGGSRVSIARATDPIPGVDVFLVDAPALYDRTGLYGASGADYPDNAERFAALVHATLAALPALGLEPDVLHCHDWQAALAAALLEGRGPPTILTIHNLAYQGVFPMTVADAIGIPAWLRTPAHLEFHGGLSFLKGGIVAADRVTTVSPSYAREIAMPELGHGLDGTLAGLDPPVVGILNGIDTGVWNPGSDPHLPVTYDALDPSGKAAAKRALQHDVDLPIRPDVPVFGMVARLVEQKGIDLITGIGDRLAALDAQYVFLGTGAPEYEAAVARLAETHSNVAARIEFSDRLAHLIEAGSDFFLMPSRFEPCGLNQMISQRYGTVPIVHGVGGLADSVVHASPAAIADETATGIVFLHHDPAGLSWAIDYALELYARPDVLTAIIRAGMTTDFSWASSGARYEALYESVA
jgi:starch synthase